MTLLVDKGVTLYGSRDAAVYEMKGEGVTPGLCGTIATGGRRRCFLHRRELRRAWRLQAADRRRSTRRMSGSWVTA